MFEVVTAGAEPEAGSRHCEEEVRQQEVVTAIPPQAGEAGGRHCDPARGGRSKRINVHYPRCPTN